MTLKNNPDIHAEILGSVGFITLTRPRALNALSLPMVRTLLATLRARAQEPAVLAVAIRGSNKEGPFGAFCAGGDLKFFHQAVLAGDAALDAFFTEEYTLNHLIHTYPKPYIAFMDGIVMGGGMGITQGASQRIVTERTLMAMPETAIGLFPDVGGGYFLSRCPGRVGEYLALTGQSMGAADAVATGLADGLIPSGQLSSLWHTLGHTPFESSNAIEHYVASKFVANYGLKTLAYGHIDSFFAENSVSAIVHGLEAAAADGPSDSPRAQWAAATAATLRSRSHLMLHVVLEQMRRARSIGLTQDLHMERCIVHHCFALRPGPAGETMEGIRALVIDKDHHPKWNPARVEDVPPELVAQFFVDPWGPGEHPLAALV